MARPTPWRTMSWSDVLGWLHERIVLCPSGCWIWAGADSGGEEEEGRGRNYPKMKIAGKTYYVHRVMYFLLIGPIPEGKQLDHVCKHWNGAFPLAHRRCVNPWHCEPVYQSDNLKRNNIGKQLNLELKG